MRRIILPGRSATPVLSDRIMVAYVPLREDLARACPEVLYVAIRAVFAFIIRAIRAVFVYGLLFENFEHVYASNIISI